MAAHSQSEVQAALNYLLTGNGGKPLTADQMAWELNPANGNSFGECLYLAAKRPDLFPNVLIAPFMQRDLIGRQFTIDGKVYPPTTYDSDGPVVGFGFPAYLFRNAVLV
jgi:hypothetical protein